MNWSGNNLEVVATSLHANFLLGHEWGGCMMDPGLPDEPWVMQSGSCMVEI